MTNHWHRRITTARLQDLLDRQCGTLDDRDLWRLELQRRLVRQATPIEHGWPPEWLALLHDARQAFQP